MNAVSTELKSKKQSSNIAVNVPKLGEQPEPPLIIKVSPVNCYASKTSP